MVRVAGTHRTVIAFLLVGCWVVAAVTAQEPSEHSCAVRGADQFDFWIGTWDVTWGEDSRGTNVVRRILDDCIIEERFEGQMPGGVFAGRSVSAYDPTRDRWRQTWVDNRGGYLEFEGGMRGDSMILRREGYHDGEPVLQRMVWHHIEEHRLDWNWERSDDGGETWTLLWQIHYERRRSDDTASQ